MPYYSFDFVFKILYNLTNNQEDTIMVEKLKNDDFRRFAKKFHACVKSFERNEDRSACRLTLFVDPYYPELQLVLTDSGCRTNRYFESYQPAFEKAWLNFLSEEFSAEITETPNI